MGRADAALPVHLVTALEPSPAADLLVNLGGRLPPGLERFAAVAEIVDADAGVPASRSRTLQDLP